MRMQFYIFFLTLLGSCSVLYAYDFEANGIYIIQLLIMKNLL